MKQWEDWIIFLGFRDEQYGDAVSAIGKWKESLAVSGLGGDSLHRLSELLKTPRIRIYHSCCLGLSSMRVANETIEAGWVDGGGLYLLHKEYEKAKELGVKPLAKIVTGASAGVDPSIMGIGPVYATRKALKKAGLELKDIDLIEANEAFAAQSVAVANELGFDMDKVNVNGGAVALGHPIGASGCRILVTLLYEMKRRGFKYGLATLCVGGGMGVATVVEAL